MSRVWAGIKKMGLAVGKGEKEWSCRAFNLGEKGSHCSVFENEVSTADSFPWAARVGARIPLKVYCNSQGRRQGLLV